MPNPIPFHLVKYDINQSMSLIGKALPKRENRSVVPITKKSPASASVMESIGTFKVHISSQNFQVHENVDLHLSFKGAHMSPWETVGNCESQV